MTDISSYYQGLLGKTQFWQVPVRIERATNAPLDSSTLFKTYADALTYAQGGTVSYAGEGNNKKKNYTQSNAYPGQYIAVVPEDGSATSAFVINGQGELVPLATGSDLETTLTQLQSDLSTLSANALSDIADEVSARIADVTALSDAIYSEVSARVANVSVLSGAITTLETKSNDLSGDIAANLSVITKLSGEFQDFSEISLSGVEAVKEQLTVTVEELESAESGYLKTYVVKQNGEQVGASINIPKDFLVKSATVKECAEANDPVAGYVVGDKYLDFVLNTAETTDGTEEAKHVYIKLTDLAAIYKGGETETITVNVVNGVITATLKNSSVTTDHLKDNAVTNAKLGLSAVATTNIQDSAITEVKLSDGAVSEGKIKEDAVTTSKIKDQAVTSAKLATDSVTTVKIVDKAVTTAKLDDQAVTTDKLANKAVTRDKLSDELTTAIDSFATKAALKAEEDARLSADNVLDSKIAAETTRATSVESGLRTDLDAEIARAKGIEEGLRTDLTNEINRSEAKDGELTQAIADEANAARAAEQALGERIDNLTLSEITVPANQTIDKISQTNGKVSVTTKDIEINASQVTGLDDALTSFVKVDNFNTVSSDLNTRLSTVSNDLDTLEGTVEGLVKTVGDNKSELEGSIKTISDNLSTVSSDLDTLEGTVGTLAGTVESNKTTLEGSIKTVSDNLAELSGTVINTVSSDLDKLEDTVGTLQTNLGTEINKKLASEDFAKLSIEIGLDVATKDNKVVTQKDIADLAGAMHFKGVVVKQEGESDLAAIAKVFPDAVAGDIVMIQGSTLEYVYNGTEWMPLGDETVYTTKVVFDQKVEELIAADTAISTAVDNKILVGGQKLESLKIYHVTQDEYHQKVVDGSILSNELYIVSSDTINAYDERIVNVGAPSADTDAANKKYVDDSVKTVSDKANSIDGRVTELSGKALFGITLNGQTVSVTDNIASLVITKIECGSATA